MKKGSWIYAIAPAVCLAVFWRMPFIWFRTDDFAWLEMHLEVHGLPSLFAVLFRPEAQGTVRVLGDRIPFLVLSSLFGTWAAPFRGLTLVTWFAALILASAIGARLAGSRWAGVTAAVFWTASYAVTIPLIWASAYDQVLCAALMLAALYGRMRWLDSREGKWRALEWTAYLLSFGALEIVVVYPAVALLYTWAVARQKDRTAYALFVPAAVFSALHFALIPKTTAEVYRIAMDARLPVTALRYLKVALGPAGSDLPKALPMAVAVALIAALGWFLILRVKQGQWAALFCVAWFAIFIAPVLPLPNHFSVYYLTLPVLGLCWLAGWAMCTAWRLGQAARISSIALAVLFLSVSIRSIQADTAWWLEHTSRMRLLIRAVEQEGDDHPGTALILKDVDDELFQTGFEDDPFKLSGISRVYLAPGSEAAVRGRDDLGGVSRFRISPGDAAVLIASGQARVLDLNGNAPPRDITSGFGRALAAQFLDASPGLVEVGNPLYASRLGSGWYPPENNFRWSAKLAKVTLAPGSRLVVTGFGAPAALAQGPVDLHFYANAKDAGSCKVTRPGEKFECNLAVPVGAGSPLQISVESSRTFSPPGDARELGMVFLSFETK